MKFSEFLDGYRRKLIAMQRDLGEPALRNKRHQEAWAEATTAFWEMRGVQVEITFTGGREK
jgi:hypothetical protein